MLVSFDHNEIITSLCILSHFESEMCTSGNFTSDLYSEYNKPEV